MGIEAAHRQPIRLLVGCLNLFRWALWVVAFALTVLLIVQKLHEDPALRPLPEVVAIAAFMLVAMMIGRVTQRISVATDLWAGQEDVLNSDVTRDSMQDVRREIDRLDDEIVALMALRQRQIERAVRVKQVLGLPARVPARVDEVLARVADAAAREGLDQGLAHRLWQDMIEWSIRLEEQLMHKDTHIQ